MTVASAIASTSRNLGSRPGVASAGAVAVRPSVRASTRVAVIGFKVVDILMI
jgi:hypothetical protein